jgi:hypothetical protein
LPSAEQIIRARARKYGLDPRAVIAVAMGEGGLRNRPGDIGDLSGGGSFGPFQLYTQGALPAHLRGNQRRADAWAWSPQGIDYALRQMAKHARGKRGRAAVEAIIRQFERPADPDSSVRNALSRYGSVEGGGAMPPSGGGFVGRKPPGGGGMKQAGISALNQIASGDFDPVSMLNDIAAASWQQSQRTPPRKRVAPNAPINGKGFVVPLKTPMTSGSEFGVADAEGAPSARGGRYHAAKDWFAPGGSPVMSPVSGRIVEVKRSKTNSGQVFGGVVKIIDRGGRVFVFRHVDPRKLKVGQRVDAGSLIASVTPWRDGSPHAHIEVWKTLKGGYRFENMIDPALLFD